jgi:hypothetical protein
VWGREQEFRKTCKPLHHKRNVVLFFSLRVACAGGVNARNEELNRLSAAIKKEETCGPKPAGFFYI